MTEPPQGHDVVAIGASAGGVDALQKLPAELNAAVFVVLHAAPTFPSQLHAVLGRESRLPITVALHGEKTEPGRVYLAPPDNQLFVRRGFIHVHSRDAEIIRNLILGVPP